MKLTIFARVLIGYLVLILLVVIIGAYTYYQMIQIHQFTESILTINNEMMDRSEKLLDLIYSQVRYEKKFLISKDDIFYEEFQKLQKDFRQTLSEMKPPEEFPQARLHLKNIEEFYQAYQSRVHEETKSIKEGSSRTVFSASTNQKEETTQSLIRELEKLKVAIRQNSTDKIKKLNAIGTEFRRMGMLIIGAFILIGIFVSILIKRSITHPVSLLKKKTREIGQGNFKGDLSLVSPPELAELAGAFNLMCNRLKDLEQMKSDFFSTITHELRSPLSTIKLGMDLLKEGVEGPITDGQRELLSGIQKECLRLMGLVNSLLDLSKMEAGMMPFHLQPQPIAPLIEQTLQEMKPLIDSKKIDIQAKMMQGLPDLKMDRERMLQALRNIIGNAVKFTPEGGQIKIAARSVDHGVEVSVADTGPGIPKENLITIFEKFQQVATDRAFPHQGTGLGLAIAKQIITRHGGKIWANSQLGQGSTFFFFLPA